MKIYADTSIFGGVFDKEFSTPSKKFFQLVDSKRITLVTSAVVKAEIEYAPNNIQIFFERYASISEIADIDERVLKLRDEYIKAGIVTKNSMDDALHVAIATLSRCDIIVSWNFKHIVHYDKIPKYNAVNILFGYTQIDIFSPLEVIDYDE